MRINKNVAQKGKFTLSACLPACSFGEIYTRSVCYVCMYVCMYVVCKENFVLYEYVYGTYPLLLRVRIDTDTRFKPYDKE